MFNLFRLFQLILRMVQKTEKAVNYVMAVKQVISHRPPSFRQSDISVPLRQDKTLLNKLLDHFGRGRSFNMEHPGKLTDPDRLVITRFVVSKVEHAGFAPELNIELAAIRKGEQGEPWQAWYTVTGYTL